MPDLLIVGTGGLAKEVAQLARLIDPEARRWPCLEYVTNEPKLLGTAMTFGKIAWTDDDVAKLDKRCDVVIAVGSPISRRMISQRLGGNALLHFPNLVHPKVHLDKTVVSIGCGNILTEGVIVTCDVAIGNFNLINWNTTVGHDVRIGSYNVVNPGSNVSGGVQIGDVCLLGVGCQVLEGLNIASEVIVGGGAVVTRSLESSGTYVGVPARLTT